MSQEKPQDWIVSGGGVSEQHFESRAKAISEAEARIEDCRDCGEWTEDVSSISIAQIVSRVAMVDKGQFVDFKLQDVDRESDLLAALTEARAWIPTGEGTPLKRGANCDCLTTALEMIDAALAKALEGTSNG